MTSPVLLPKYEHDSPEWHEARRNSIGGSDIAAVLGLSPWTSPFTLWQLKAGNIEPNPPNRFTEWGQLLEPVVAGKFCAEHPEVQAYVLQGHAYAHGERAWQTASPDVYMFYEHNELVETFCEIKTGGRADAWYDGIPIYYRTQILWTMDVLGVDHAWCAALIGGNDYREYRVEMDADAQADLVIMRERGEQFMASLAEGVAPDIDDSYGTYETIKRLSPDIEPDAEVEFDRDVAEAYIAAAAAEAEAKRTHQAARNKVARHMLAAQYATCEGVRFARRQPYRDGPAVLVRTNKALTLKENAA